jgi:hypothetical protein
MTKKQTLLLGSDDDKPIDDELKVNESFKQKFEYNKRRQLLEQGRLKYGDMLNEEGSESESSSSSDDSEAKFVNPKFEKKFLEVMTAIRESNPKVLTKTGDNSVGEHLWKDDDFEYEEG